MSCHIKLQYRLAYLVGKSLTPTHMRNYPLNITGCAVKLGGNHRSVHPNPEITQRRRLTLNRSDIFWSDTACIKGQTLFSTWVSWIQTIPSISIILQIKYSWLRIGRYRIASRNADASSLSFSWWTNSQKMWQKSRWNVWLDAYLPNGGNCTCGCVAKSRVWPPTILLHATRGSQVTVRWIIR